MSLDVDMSEMSEELLSVSPVNHTLFADTPAGNSALETYLAEKIFVSSIILDIFCILSGSGPVVQHYCHGLNISIHIIFNKNI